VALRSSRQTRQGSSMIYRCIPNFTPTCFRNSLSSSGGCIYLRSYSDNICVVDVYGLQFVQCGQLSRDVTKSLGFVGCFMFLFPLVGRKTHSIVIHSHNNHTCLHKYPFYLKLKMWGTQIQRYIFL
jgi:hypothetical protein